MASNGQPPANPPQTPQPTSQQLAATSNIISALGQVLKNQTGEAPQNDKIAQLLLANMAQLSQLLKSGKLNQTQIEQLREFVDKNKAGGSSASATPAPVAPSPVATPGPSTARYTPPTHVTIPQSINPAFKSAQAATTLTSQAGGGFPISNTLSTTNPGPITWATAQQGRPTLSGGIPGGRISGTPSQLSRTADDASMLSSDTSSRRKNSPNDQSMRRSIQELVSSIDPSVKIEPEVEDLLLDIADEFIDSVTNFGCRLAKHRGGESLEVRDLQLHLERNHNIRIPGFASDETRISISQSVIAPAASAGGASSSNKKNAQSSQMTLRSHRLAQVSQAKKEAKLM